MNLNLNESLKYFKNVILQATDRVWHYERPSNESFPYAVWTEYTEGDSLNASNRKKTQPVTILLDYYTQTEFDPVIDTIQEVLNEAPGIVFELADMLYDEETRSIHYSWSIEVLYGKNNQCGLR